MKRFFVNTFILLGLAASITACSTSATEDTSSNTQGTSGSTTNGDNTQGTNGNTTGGSTDNEIVVNKSVSFLNFHQYEKDGAADPIKEFQSITVSDADSESPTVNIGFTSTDIYPLATHSYLHHFDSTENYCVMTMNKDFDENLSLVKLPFDGTFEQLPLPKDGKYLSSYKEGSAKIEGNYVFYETKAYYYEAFWYTFWRYNITDKSKIVVSQTECNSFILSQPEKGSDTEGCTMGTFIIPSTDGKDIYGAAVGDGEDFGRYHTDYSILYKYNFDTSTYTRLGDDSSVSFKGATSDSKYLLYSNHQNDKYICKVYNVDTDTIKTIPDGAMYSCSGDESRSEWNSRGFISGTHFNDIISGTSVDVLQGETNNVYQTQFAPDGNSIYFILRSDKTTLYKTDDLSEASPYHKVMNIAEEDELFVLKNAGMSNGSSTGSSTTDTTVATGGDNSGTSCVWIDSSFENCIDNLSATQCTAHEREPYFEDEVTQIYISPQTCLENSFEYSFTDNDGYTNYFR